MRMDDVRRFDDATALDDDQLRQLVPSVFATTAHSSRSERFAPIPTISVVHALQREGFLVVGAKQCKARDHDKQPYTKHLLRLRRAGEGGQNYQVQGTVFEILLKNANDGSSVYDLFAGLYRILCMNGMTAATGHTDTLRVRHTGDVEQKVIEGSHQILTQAERALAAPPLWSAISLSEDDRMEFATSAHRIRFANSDGEVTTSIKPGQLLEARRSEDRGNDLWRTFNVTQENCIRGGLHGVGQDAQGRTRRSTTREVHGIDSDLRINRKLWLLADTMAVLKGARSLIEA